MGRAGPEELAFGVFRLSLRERVLFGPQGPEPLPSRAFDVLLTLIEGGAAVVSKDELMRRVWGASVVHENNLHVQIAALRRALGAQARDIQTIPRRGYRFIGEVVAHAPARPDAPSRSWRPARAPRELPAEMTQLLGRDVEVAQACARLSQARLVSLVGPPGVGKSRLARAVAARLGTRFAGGCRWVELAAAPDPAFALVALAAALGVEARPARTLAVRIAETLEDAEVLLALDGCEHLAEPVAGLARRLLAAAPRLRILCAAQAPLDVDGEHVLRIEPFETCVSAGGRERAAALPAVRLFAERAAAVDGRFAVTEASLPAVLEICRALDGLPLAIELAAASAPLIGLEPLRCARPADRLALLEDGWRAGAPRLPLRRSLERSCGLLTARQRAVLARLGRFERSFTLAEAQAANDRLERAEAARAVAALAHRSLLQVSADPAQPRYRMLQVVRTVALEDVAEEPSLPWDDADRGEAAGRERWAPHLGAFAE